MRTVKFPAVTDANLNPGNLLAQCLNPPNGGGINVTEMALRLPIAQKLRVANGKVKLEDAEWEKLKKANPDLFNGLSPNVMRADLGEKGIYYRLQAGPLAGAAQATDLCEKAKSRKLGCIVVRP